ncbi:succinyl-CoA synthetase subunit alpha [archaeon]|nr:succinyl-CoA synthetase subunit alpha [archaeon]
MEKNSEIKGKWIVLLGEHIIESGDDIKEIYKNAQKKYPKSKLILARVPEEGTLIY